MEKGYLKELEPHLNSIIKNARSHAWLMEFYENELHKKILQMLDAIVGKSIEKNLPPEIELERLWFIQKYFECEKNDPRYQVFHQFFAQLGNAQKKLQDLFVQNITQKEIDSEQTTILPSYTQEVLKEIAIREIILYIRDQLKILKNHAAHSKYSKLKYWTAKELNNLAPISRTTQLDTQRFQTIHDPNATSLDFSIWFNNIWYFLNGASRVSVFLQNEISSFKRIYQIFLMHVRKLAHDANTKRLECLYYLPLYSVKFLWDTLYLLFIPYRFVRTIANELCDRFKRILEWGTERLPINLLERNNKIMLILFMRSSQLMLFLALLWFFGLPILPNPFSWLPNLGWLFYLSFPLLYGMGVIFGSLILVIANHFASHHFPTAKPQHACAAIPNNQDFDQRRKSIPYLLHAQLFTPSWKNIGKDDKESLGQSKTPKRMRVS